VSQHHYDVIALGSSRATRIALTLLAKRGWRTLVLDEAGPAASVQPLSSLHLDRLLENLVSASTKCSPPPFQLISEDIRIDFNGAAPLKEELAREFPEASERIGEFLTDLKSLGNALEESLFDSGGLPSLGIASRLRFSRQLFKKRLTSRKLNKPLDKALEELGDGKVTEAMATLFAGLALVPHETLSVAEAALLWHWATRPGGISPAELDEILENRYRQFRGAQEKLSRLQEFMTEGGRPVGIVLKGGHECTARHYLIGSATALPLLPAFLCDRLKAPETASRTLHAELTGDISPLLAPEVIQAAPFPLRLTFAPSPGNTSCTVQYAAPLQEKAPSEQEIIARLAQVLPFCTINFAGEDLLEHSDDPAGKTAAKAFPAGASPIRCGRQSLLCSETMVLPHLGTLGGVILGLSTANYLLKRLDKKGKT